MRQAATGELISELTANSLLTKTANVLKEICLVTGLKIEEQYAVEFTKIVNRFLLTYHGALTPAEVSLAFNMNAAGELPTKTVCYGQNLTIEHIGGVLHSYRQKRVDLATKIAEMKHPELVEPEPTEEEKYVQSKQFCEEYYSKWLNRDFSPVTLEYAHMVYDSLVRLGSINLTVEEKKAWFDEAQGFRDRELALPTVDRIERKKKNGLIAAYLNNAIPQDEKELVKKYAKRLALLDFFKICKEQGKQTIFNEKNIGR